MSGSEGSGQRCCRGPPLAWPIWRCDAAGGSQRLINHNCFNSINDVFRAARGTRRQVFDFVEVFFIVMSGPATGRRRRAHLLRAVLPCLALIAFGRQRWRRPKPSRPSCFSPARDGFFTPPGFAAAPHQRQTPTRPAMPPTTARLRDKDDTGAVADRPDPDLWPARRQRRRRLRLRLAQPHAQEAEYYPAQARPKPPPGPGSPPPPVASASGGSAFRSRRRRPPTRRRSRRRWPAP